MRLVQDRDPAQRQAHCHRRAQQDGGRDLESLQVDVRLVETVEEHEAVGALLVELVRESCEISEEGTELHRDWDFHLCFHGSQDCEVARLDFLGGELGIGRDRVDIQLQRIRAGLLDLPCERHPAAERRAVQAGDDREGPPPPSPSRCCRDKGPARSGTLRGSGK